MTRVTIEVERTEEPIQGTLCVETRPDCCFVGWIGLLAALEAALETDPQEETDSAPTD
jgi:hypothetical protein